MVTKTSHLPIRYFLALLWAHPILHISRIRVKYVPVQALNGYGEGGYISTHFLTSHCKEVRGQIYGTAALRPGKWRSSPSELCWQIYSVGNTFDITHNHLQSRQERREK